METELYYKNVVGAHWFLKLIRHEKDVEIVAHCRFRNYGFTPGEYLDKLRELMNESRGEFNLIEAPGTGRIADKVELHYGLVHETLSVRNPMNIFLYEDHL